MFLLDKQVTTELISRNLLSVIAFSVLFHTVHYQMNFRNGFTKKVMFFVFYNFTKKLAIFPSLFQDWIQPNLILTLVRKNSEFNQLMPNSWISFIQILDKYGRPLFHFRNLLVKLIFILVEELINVVVEICAFGKVALVSI